MTINETETRNEETLNEFVRGHDNVRLLDLIDRNLIPYECEIAGYPDCDAPYATVVDLKKETFTEAGRAYWSDVLGMRVKEVTDGAFGIFIHLWAKNQAENERVRDFTLALGGHCYDDLYREWFSEDD